MVAAGLIWLAQQVTDAPAKIVGGYVTDVGDRWMMSTNDRTLAQDHVMAKSAYVMDAESGNVLFYKNENKHMPPASTTKMMTALLALEEVNLEEVVMVGKEVLWAGEDESSAGLRPGQLISWRELITAMMLPSGNDAARTIAVQMGMKHVSAGATREQAYQAFVKLMNDHAALLDMRDTHYRNPHGLHERDHYTTAKDLGKLALVAMKNEDFRNIVQKRDAYIGTTYQESTDRMTVTNRNQLLQPESGYYYEGAIGIKTGFTDQAGYCLVSSAVRDGREVIAVVLHSGMEEVWADSILLLDYGFAHWD